MEAWKLRVLMWLLAWVGLAECLVEILSLGLIVPQWKYSLLMSASSWWFDE